MSEHGYNVTFVTDHVVATVTVAADPHGGPVTSGDLSGEQARAVANLAVDLAAADGITLRRDTWEEISDA
jgi:hypothetical protein